MKLTTVQIDKAKPSKNKDRFLDGDRLYVRVFPTGTKSFQRKHQDNSKKTTWITLGKYKEELSLKQARLLNAEIAKLAAAKYSVVDIKQCLTKTKDPVEIGKMLLGFKPESVEFTNELTFSDMHKIWHDYKSPSWKNKVHRHQAWRNVEYYMYPFIGHMPMSKIETMDIVRALEPIWVEKHETAARLKQWTSKIFAMAMTPAYGLIKTNAAAFDTEFLLPEVRPSEKHQASVNYEQMPRLWTAINALPGMSKLGKNATLLVLLTAKRAGEVVNMKWNDIDLENAEWNVFDEAQTKTGMPHRCPLPSKAVEILNDMKAITGDRENVFYRNNINQRIALDVPRKNLQSAWGNKDVTAHGTRHSFKTWSAEVGYRRELSEMQLSHEQQGIEAVYNDADYLRDRKVMMQHWQESLMGEVTLEERHRV